MIVAGFLALFWFGGQGLHRPPLPFPPPHPSLAALIQEALQQKPEVQEARATIEARRARIPQAGALPDPMRTSGVMNEKCSMASGVAEACFDEQMAEHEKAMARLGVHVTLPAARAE